jgi:hypothetical protein
MSETKHWDADENYVVDLNTSEVLFEAVYAQEDDMRMVIAAPELLKALQDILSLYESDEGCRDLKEYKQARAAISKATGE